MIRKRSGGRVGAETPPTSGNRTTSTTSSSAWEITTTTPTTGPGGTTVSGADHAAAAATGGNPADYRGNEHHNAPVSTMPLAGSDGGGHHHQHNHYYYHHDHPAPSSTYSTPTSSSSNRKSTATTASYHYQQQQQHPGQSLPPSGRESIAPRSLPMNKATTTSSSSSPFFNQPTRLEDFHVMFRTPLHVPDSQYGAYLAGARHRRNKQPGPITTQCCARGCAGFSMVGAVFLLWVGILLDTQPLYIKSSLPLQLVQTDDAHQATAQYVIPSTKHDDRLAIAIVAYRASIMYLAVFFLCTYVLHSDWFHLHLFGPSLRLFSKLFNKDRAHYRAIPDHHQLSSRNGGFDKKGALPLYQDNHMNAKKPPYVATPPRSLNSVDLDDVALDDSYNNDQYYHDESSDVEAGGQYQQHQLMLDTEIGAAANATTTAYQTNNAWNRLSAWTRQKMVTRGWNLSHWSINPTQFMNSSSSRGSSSFRASGASSSSGGAGSRSHRRRKGKHQNHRTRRRKAVGSSGTGTTIGDGGADDDDAQHQKDGLATIVSTDETDDHLQKTV